MLPVIIFFGDACFWSTHLVEGGGAVIRQQVQLDDPAEIADILRRLPSAFPEALAELMRWRGESSETLAKKALYHKSTINRLRSEIDYVSSPNRSRRDALLICSPHTCFRLACW